MRYRSRGDRRHYPVTDLRFTGEDESLLDLEFVPAFPKEVILQRPPTMWRYREALPVPDGAEPVTFGEGFTPLLGVPFTDDRGREREVLIKQEHLFPSGSYKDRGASMLITLARAIGVTSVVEDSSGNAGAAVAAYCARAGIRCRIFTPDSTSSGKLAQILSYGADLVRTPGPREETARAVLHAARGEEARGDNGITSAPTFYASHSYNPFFFHGTKTFAFEVWEQLGWSAPDALVLPAGNGTLLLGVAIGFAELHAAGMNERPPALFAVQAERCAPLAAAVADGRLTPGGPDGRGWQRGGGPGGTTADDAPSTEAPDTGAGPPETPRPPGVTGEETIAEGIAIATPIRADQIIDAVLKTGGAFLTVNEDEIHEAHRRMTRMGFCIEPTSAATIAAIPRALSALPGDARVVSLFSGHGLKAPGKLPVV
jgi:threonine synthase